MFGYVRAHSAELKVKEYEMYRGAYCGLCRSMGKCTGQCSRMTLSYDFAFLVLLRICVTNDKISFAPRRCIAHPLKKRSMMERNGTLDFCARAAAILNYHKIKDDLADEKGFSRLRARLALPLVAHARKKALRAGLSELDAQVSALLCELRELEEKRLPSVDAPADVFGRILALICSYGLEDAEERLLSSIGYSVGKWIYSVDALDDMRDDVRRGSYNPFLLLYGGREPSEEQMRDVISALRASLCGAEMALDLVSCDCAEVRNIVENIMYLGLDKVMDDVIKRRDADKDKIDSKDKKDKRDKKRKTEGNSI